MKYRIGMGFDTHQLAEGYPLVIGGVHIDYPMGFKGHSDADLLIHAIIDGLFGAANMHDIGYHFPDTDPKYKGIRSTLLLEECADIISKNGWHIENIDCTLVLQKPQMLPYINAMKLCLAPLMHISTEDISIKAKTSEKIGFIGREEGASAYAVVLISKE